MDRRLCVNEVSPPREGLRIEGSAVSDKQDPTNCDRCKASLEHGWCERWRNDKRVEVMCFDCDKKERHERYAEDDVLTTRLLTDAEMYGVRLEYGKEASDPLLDRVRRESDRIKPALKRFESAVWFGGLQSLVRDTQYRGHRATFEANGTKADALVWSCAGQTLITIEPADGSYSVTLITAEDSSEPVMGIQGIRATWGDARALIDAAAKLRTADFARDDKIGVM